MVLKILLSLLKKTKFKDFQQIVSIFFYISLSAPVPFKLINICRAQLKCNTFNSYTSLKVSHRCGAADFLFISSGPLRERKNCSVRCAAHTFSLNLSRRCDERSHRTQNFVRVAQIIMEHSAFCAKRFITPGGMRNLVTFDFSPP